MKSIINVALNLPLYGTYSYLIPEGIDNIKIGVRVEVPFGRKKLIGICVGVDKDSKLEKQTYKLKYLNNIIDKKPIMTSEILKLGKWASEYYQYPLGQVLFSCLPSKIKSGSDIKITDDKEYTFIATGKVLDTYFKNKHAQKKLYNEIKSSKGIESDVIKNKTILKSLLENGFISKELKKTRKKNN